MTRNTAKLQCDACRRVFVKGTRKGPVLLCGKCFEAVAPPSYTGPLRSMSGIPALRDIEKLYVRRLGQMDRGPDETA